MRVNTGWLGLAGVVAIAGLAPCALAQWSSDPTFNTEVAGGVNEQGVPLVRPTADGGAWITFFDNGASNGYKPTIQRLTPSGAKAFPGNGIVLANRTNSATFTYDLEVDASGNAIVAFDDNSSGTGVITVQKVEPDGDLPWGATGVQMPGSTNALGPVVSVCQDGTIVACWQLTRVLYFQRMNADGTLVAGGTWSLEEAGRAQSPSDMVTGGNAGDVILLWRRNEGTNAVTSRAGLKIQKWNSLGQPQWSGPGGPGTALDVYASSATPLRGLQSGYFPALHSDGAGGAITAWYDNAGTRNAWLQHVLSDGTQRFALNGLAASTTTNATEFRLSAAVAFDAAAQEYVVAFEKSNTTQSQYGLGAQRIQANGTLLWGGGAGLDVLPIGGNHKSFVNVASTSGGTAVISWLDYQGANDPMFVRATKLDTAGAPVWASPIVDAANAGTSKGRLSMAKAAGSDMVICAWADGASGSVDTKAQNINPDGSLGDNTPTCPADLDNDGDFGNGGSPDGGVDVSDLLYFLAGFELGNASVDLDNGTGTGTPDGGVDVSDLLFFLVRFEAGC